MQKQSLHQRIQAYNLFGETGDMPDIVHCERISERSKLHNWELAPHRHARLHQFLLIERGGGRAVLEGETHTLAPGRLVNAPTGCVHAFFFTPATEGYVLTIATEVFDEVWRESEGKAPGKGGNTSGEMGGRLATAWAGTSPKGARGLMRMIFEEYSALKFGRAHMLRALCAQLAGLAARQMGSSGTSASTSADNALLRRFEALLDAHYTGHWHVATYATRLGCAPGHPSRACRLASGLSASRLIEARLVREARRLLAFTRLGIAQIGYELGFADPAYFTRVFARATGLSPRTFRKRTDVSDLSGHELK